VRDHRPSVGKLDPRAVRCIFLDYASSQKGYQCWDLIGRKLYASMDVTFREHEPYYTTQVEVILVSSWRNSLLAPRVIVERGRLKSKQRTKRAMMTRELLEFPPP
jgi:hypothetical protein